MKTAHPALVVGAAIAVTAALALWAAVEAREQRAAVEQALTLQAQLLAESLGASLEAAALAEREVEEQVTRRLLDDARLLARLLSTKPPTRALLEEIAEETGVETIALLDRAGAVSRQVGPRFPPSLAVAARDALSRGGDSWVLFAAQGDPDVHVSAGVPWREGVLLVRAHAAETRTFGGERGEAALLAALVESSAVLYLVYEDTLRPSRIERSWDGEGIPEAEHVENGVFSLRGRPVFEARVPMSAPAGGLATLRVGLDATSAQDAGRAVWRRTLLVDLVLLVLGTAGLALAWLIRSRSLERAESAKELARSEAARRQSERLAAAGALTAGLAHEVRSPLNAISLAAQRVERCGASEREGAAFAARIRGEVQRLERVLRHFLEFASPVGADRTLVELGPLARDIAALLAEEAAIEGVEVNVRGDARVECDADSMRRVLINVVRNGIEASPRNTAVEIRLGQTENGGEIEVADRGPGVPDGMEERAFEAFVTTRAKGTGLGLALVKRVIEEHGGDSCLAPRRGGGTVFRCRLPRSGAKP